MGFLDNMKQLMEVKAKMEETKKRLDSIEVFAENELVKVTATGNRKIKQILLLKPDLQNTDILILEEKIKDAVNAALENAENVLQSEMMGVTKGIIPPGMA